MRDRKILYIPVAIAAALAALLFAGTGVGSLAQMSSESSSGTINSLVQENGETTFILGGEWSLSLDGEQVTDFSADLDMTSSDGTGAHTHRIEMAGNQSAIEFAEPTATDAPGEVTVTLSQAEQSVGGTVLVNASGLEPDTETHVNVGDMIAGITEPDETGNLLFALGITEEMIGSATVTVEQIVNSGSAALAVTTSNVPTTQPGSLTEPETTGNATGLEGNATATEPSESMPGETTNSTVIQSQSYESDTTEDTIAPSDNTDSSVTSESTTDLDAGGELTTFEEEAIAAGEVFEGMEGTTNATSDGANATSTANANAASTTGASGTSEILADIYTDDQLVWDDVNVTITLMNEVIMIEIDQAATENHFGNQPIFGMSGT
jgi:hypothetical protein